MVWSSDCVLKMSKEFSLCDLLHKIIWSVEHINYPLKITNQLKCFKKLVSSLNKSWLLKIIVHVHILVVLLAAIKEGDMYTCTHAQCTLTNTSIINNNNTLRLNFLGEESKNNTNQRFADLPASTVARLLLSLVHYNNEYRLLHLIKRWHIIKKDVPPWDLAVTLKYHSQHSQAAWE